MPKESGLCEVKPLRIPGSYEVLGSDMQILNLEVAPNGPTVQSAPGAMNYMAPDMQMNVNCDSCWGRCCSGESPILIRYENTGSDAQFLGLTPTLPAKIVPLEVSTQGGQTFRTKNGAYFSSMGDVEVGYKCDCNPATCCCAGQGCIHQTLSGEGRAFIAAMGTLMTKELQPGEKILIDSHSLFAWSETAKLDIRSVGGLGTCCCAGEGLFNTVLEGPGTIYIQSMSFEKFAKALKVQGGGGGKKKGGGAPPAGEEMDR